MAFRSAQQARIYVGLLNASCYARTVSIGSALDALDVTAICDAAKAYIPGTNTSTFSVDGPLDVDATANAQWDALTDQIQATTNVPITFMPLGTDGAAWLMEAVDTNFDASAGASSTVDWSMTAQTSGITDMSGVVLKDATTVTADTDGTANVAPAGTTNGGVAHLHVTAYSGLTSDAIIIEGSGTGSFAGEEVTVATFASVTGLTSERVEVTGTVGRYLRVVDDVTGTGSITRTVAFSRR